MGVSDASEQHIASLSPIESTTPLATEGLDILMINVRELTMNLEEMDNCPSKRTCSELIRYTSIL